MNINNIKVQKNRLIWFEPLRNIINILQKQYDIKTILQGLKFIFINRLLKGQVEGGLTPRLNEENNEALIIGLEGAEVRVGSNGFQKNKAGEKLAETETDRLEHRTDGTDAFDTLVIGVNKFPYTSSAGFSWMGAV